MPPSLATFYIEANETNAQLFADVAGLDGIGLGFIAYGKLEVIPQGSLDASDPDYRCSSHAIFHLYLPVLG